MDELKKRHKNFQLALDSLFVSINNYKTALQLQDHSELYEKTFKGDYENYYRTVRDSLIQRFEYCVDSMWKYLKFYLENIEKITLETKSPRGIIREACQARILNEKDTRLLLKMIDYRNKTSHIYKEETADIISKEVPNFYFLRCSFFPNKKYQSYAWQCRYLLITGSYFFFQLFALKSAGFYTKLRYIG